MIQHRTFIFDFETTTEATAWSVVDDAVMGGRSKGRFSVEKEGIGVFKGKVSTQNNGGFSLVRYRFGTKSMIGHRKFVVKIKGDGKQYRFRVKTNDTDQHTYSIALKALSDWTTLEIPFNQLRPTYRGKTLDMPEYPGERLQEVAFLIGNGIAENFRLEIAWVAVE